MISLRSLLAAGLLLASVSSGVAANAIDASGAAVDGSTVGTTTNSAAGSLTVSNSAYEGFTVNFQTDSEDLYFTGDGTTQTKPIIGVVVDPATTPIPVPAANDAAAQTALNNLFNLSRSSFVTAATLCGYSGSTGGNNPQAVVSAPTSRLTLFQALPVNTAVPLYCVNSASNTHATVWVNLENVQSGAAPIGGQISWLVDGPTVDADGDVLTGPRTVTVPFLSALKVSASYLTGQVSQGSDKGGPTEWLAVDQSGGLAELVSTTSGFIAFNPLATSGKTNAGTLSITDIIGCSIQLLDGTYVTVDDSTGWSVPTETQKEFVYKPTCYFHAESYTTATATTGDQAVVSAPISITVLAPCTSASPTLYQPSDIITTLANTLNTGGSDPTFYDPDNVNGPDNTVDQHTVTLDQNAAYTVFPFYSVLEAATPYSSGILMDPIGTYLQAKAGVSPITDPLNPALVNLGYDQDNDLDHPIACFELPLISTTVNGVATTRFDETQSTVLVNDRTHFAVGTHNIECLVWDNRGSINRLSVVLTVQAYSPGNSPPGGCTNDPAFGTICGDPQFSGFLGQNYQVHGVSGQVYNILSTPSFEYNALFSYLSSGQCRSGTQCFSHPGNYFGEVGMSFKSVDGKVNTVRVVAGPVNVGLTVFVNEVPMTVSAAAVQLSEDVTLTLATPFQLEVDGVEFSLRLANSDMFINQDIAINSPLLRKIQHYKQAAKSNDSAAAEAMRAALPHGLLGQTWEYKTYPNRWKFIEGTLFEYTVAEGVLGTDFKYNRF